jgi:hypothetical protein
MKSLMMIGKQRWLNECLMMRMVQVMWGQVVYRKLFGIRRYLGRNWNLLCVIFAHVELKTLAGGKYFSALGALECRYRISIGKVKMNFPFMHHHVSVPRERFVTDIALGGKSNASS